MGRVKESKGRSDPAADLALPLFECCLALNLAWRTAEILAKRSGRSELTPQLQELAGLLAICRRRLARLTETLDAIFDLDQEEPGRVGGKRGRRR